MHDSRRAGPENDGRRIAVEVEEARVRRALAAADHGRFAGDLGIGARDRIDDRMIARDLRRLSVVADEPDFWRMILHPGVRRGGARHLIDQALLDAFVVLAGNRADAALAAGSSPGRRLDSRRPGNCR